MARMRERERERERDREGQGEKEGEKDSKKTMLSSAGVIMMIYIRCAYCDGA